MRDRYLIIFIILLGFVLYGLTLRGAPGNPIVTEFKNNLDQATNAFELSPERGRYVQVANMAERGVYDLSPEWAAVAYPDVGISKEGKLNSYFAPGVSYAALPFYVLGAKYGLAQVATFAVESLVSVITLVFIYVVGRRVFKLPRWAAFFAVLTYGFASTSWSYAITLYQNAFTACFIITAFYATWRFAQPETRHRFFYAAYVWLAYALAIFVDYPNAVLMLPVMFYLAASTFTFTKQGERLALEVRWSAIAAFIVFAGVTGLHFWHNAAYYGGWQHLAGELQHYTPPTDTVTTNAPPVTNSAGISTPANKSAVHFFHEKALPRGFYVLLFGNERGLLYFTPLFIFALLGMIYVLRKTEGGERARYVVPIALIATNVFLYSSWGDPWGGWAYGPRYLIASMPFMALFVGIALSEGRYGFMKKCLAFVLFLSSLAVSLLGALTTNAIPPKAEALALPIKTYTFLHNLPFIYDGRSSSFVYKTYLSSHLSLTDYFMIIYIVVALIAALTLLLSYRRHE